jgi:hypothetical protein
MEEISSDVFLERHQTHQTELFPEVPMNCLDLDFRHNDLFDKFAVPDAVRAVSLGHQFQSETPDKLDLIGKIFLLITQRGSQTNWHQDHTNTAVLYALLVGLKIIFMVEGTPLNCRLFEMWNSYPWLRK